MDTIQSPCGGGDGGGVRPHTADAETSSELPPPSQRSAAGEGWGGGSARIFASDVETSSDTTADESPTAPASSAKLPPPPVGEGWGEGWGEGSKPSSAASFLNDAISVPETSSAEPTATLPPPQPSPAADAGASCEGGSHSVEAGASGSSNSDSNTPTAPASPAKLPPSPCGGGDGGGVRPHTTDAETSFELPPPSQGAPAPAAGEGWGGGSELTTITDTDSSTDVGRPFMADTENIGYEYPTCDTALTTPPCEPPVTPPQLSRTTRELSQSPTGGGSLTVEESASAETSSSLPPPQPSPAANAGASCEGGSLSVGKDALDSSNNDAEPPAITIDHTPTAAQSPAVLPPPSQRSAAGEGWGGGSARISTSDMETSSDTTAKASPTPTTGLLPWLATIRTFAIREGKELLRDHVRTFFALFGPVILMTAVTWGVSFDVGQLAFAVRDHDQSAESRAITEYFSGSANFRALPPLATDADIDTALESSSAKMVIDIPPGFGRDLLRGDRPELGFYLDGAESFNAASLNGYIMNILGDYARDQTRAHGIALPPDAARMVPRYRYNPDFKSILAIAPGVLMLALSLFPAMMAAVGVVRECEIGSIANFYASPASRLQFLLGKQLPYLAAAMTSFLILYLMMRYWFGVPLNGSAAALISGTFLMCCTTTATGLLVSCFTRSQVAAIFITAVGTVMPAMSFSGFLVPVSSLQGGAYIMGKILPSAWYANLTTGTFTKGLGYPELMREHLILGSYYLLLLALATLNLKKQER